jgi:spermidine synthase
MGLLMPRLLRAGVFVAATLLFALEPMLAKLLLPALGGSPATWAACMLAFQLLLLAGYAYAYVGARYLSVRQQALLHGAVTLAASASVFMVPLGAAPMLGTLPPALAVPWLVLRRVGLPYLVLASTTPLLSRWALALGPAPALYAVSNAGALLGLLAYPSLLERFVALPAQFAGWAACFALFGSCLLPMCWAASRTESTSAAPARSERGAGAPRTITRVSIFEARETRLGGQSSARTDSSATASQKSMPVLAWLSWAFVPSAMLLAVTNYISVDVAATPLLWVMPLALYLSSFVVAFSRWNLALRGVALAAWLLGSCWLCLNALGQGAVPLFSQVASALLALFGASLLCHGELGRSKPVTGDPTGYYLSVASGGVLGGAFVSLLAPLVFSDFYELELTFAATFLLLFVVARRRGPDALSRAARLTLFLGAGLCLPLLVGETLVRHASRGREGRVVERRRSFLGPLRVVELAEGRVLTHGRIQHGMQLNAPEQRTATMYFARGTGVAQVLSSFRTDVPRRLGVVGLGVGTLASYGKSGDKLTFYELDPNVVELARRDFTFLADSAASVEGDGRLALAHETPQAFDVLVLDAFSSDAVPVHLLTREAFEIYARQLAPGGLLLANVSNRHLAVERVVRGSARATGFACAVVETLSGAVSHGAHVVWAVMARDPSALARVVAPLSPQPARTPEVLWTDSRASVLSVLR